MKLLLRNFLAVICFVLLWAAASALSPAALLPSPWRTFGLLQDSGCRVELLTDLAASVRRVIVGYAAGASVGVIFGLLTGRLPFIHATAGSMLNLLRPIPSIAIVPFAMLFLGIGESLKIVTVSYGVFFPIWISTHVGAAAISPKLLWVAKSFGCSSYEVFFRVCIPAALPAIVGGLRMGIGTAYVCLVAAEMIGTSSGLGFRVEAAHQMYQPERMVLSMAMLGLLGWLSDACLQTFVRVFAPWMSKGMTTGF